MIKYKLVKYQNEIVSVMKFHNNEFVCAIPFVDDNTDYQEYLEWVAEGGQVEEAD